MQRKFRFLKEKGKLFLLMVFFKVKVEAINAEYIQDDSAFGFRILSRWQIIFSLYMFFILFILIINISYFVLH